MGEKRAFSELNGKNMILGIQHLFAMFGATVAVPMITGMNISLALLCAGIGTLIFHWVTGGKVPVFLGSSFAFLGALSAAVETYGIPYAQGGIIFAGFVYIVIAFVVKFVGVDAIKRIFPPVVTGPVIIVIGLSLAGYAVSTAAANWWIALFTLLVVVVVAIFAKGFFKLVPILIGIAGGYILCLFLDLFFDMNLINFAAISEAAWINIPYVTEGFFTLPAFDLSVILSIAPIALVTFMEHIGDITTSGAVVGKDFFKDPGLFRTLLGDGLATSVAGFIGGPVNTTYSENTGVLATTKVYNPAVLRIAAVFAILLGFFGKFGAVLQSIPDAVKGGVFIMLFGMIAAIGIRTMSDAKLDFTYSRNLMITAVILVLGLGLKYGTPNEGILLRFGEFELVLSSLFVAVVCGVVLNLILPEKEDKVGSGKDAS